MRVLICDDDPNMIEQLGKYIIEFFQHLKLDVPIVQSYDSGESLLSDSEPKDIIFLDVKMPGLDGIFVGRELKKRNPNTIIFIVTSYVEYLDDAMRFHVFRYLTKPLDKQRLFQNMKDAIQLYNSTNIKIPIETKDDVYTVSVSDIILVEAKGTSILIHTLNRDFTPVHNLNYWVQTLNFPCFFRSHRSFIVNMKYISHFDHLLIYLCYNQHEYTAYLTKRRYSQFKKAYFLYLESMR